MSWTNCKFCVQLQAAVSLWGVMNTERPECHKQGFRLFLLSDTQTFDHAHLLTNTFMRRRKYNLNFLFVYLQCVVSQRIFSSMRLLLWSRSGPLLPQGTRSLLIITKIMIRSFLICLWLLLHWRNPHCLTIFPLRPLMRDWGHSEGLGRGLTACHTLLITAEWRVLAKASDLT